MSRSDASRADALEDSLLLVLTRLQPTSTRFSFPNHELSSRKSQAVVIDDEEALDSHWLSVITTSKPDKAAIKEALKAGPIIPGAQLVSPLLAHPLRGAEPLFRLWVSVMQPGPPFPPHSPHASTPRHDRHHPHPQRPQCVPLAGRPQPWS